uniref:Uncharacterized protein n=1 Tax=Chromera velia CCMP2878 TaxID=1169474 RepID=A0A0G4FZP1_9ALVE|eukprot:Cvel_19524.t1-p1 / transcript=Cvel_19524.t1 / gene=Cvel_19524 / organism=Chromera_velia_CCMP2878 / gene_product=hypothetical protein / transcript_product=hypothetical protein / location=Cvel_scaffold1690:17131-17808(-) / protein_length=118 / sequence_SO=supercontig / SO=protein_coding / is_pseudo=false
MPAPLMSIQTLRGGSTLIIYPIFIFHSPFYESRLRTPQHPGRVNIAAREGGQRERGEQREKGGLRLLQREGGRKERPLGGREPLVTKKVCSLDFYRHTHTQHETFKEARTLDFLEVDE